MIDAHEVFEDLYRQASTRQARSLKALNNVLEEQYKTGVHRFSIAEVARLSATQGGPSAQTIRNKTGLVYRQLIGAWAAQAGVSTKNPISADAKSNRVPKYYQLLQLIPDQAVRALFGQIIAERNRFRNELNILKSQSNLIVDKRPTHKLAQSSAHCAVQIVPAPNLNDMEIQALKAAVSDDFFEVRSWVVSQAGQVKDDCKREIYKHGYVNAIKKILSEISV